MAARTEKVALKSSSFFGGDLEAFLGRMVEIILPSCSRSAPRSPFNWIYPELTSQEGIHVWTGYSKWRTSSSTFELLWGTQASYPATKATPTLQKNGFCTLINISTIFYQSPPAAHDRMWKLKRKPTDKKKESFAFRLRFPYLYFPRNCI